MLAQLSQNISDTPNIENYLYLAEIVSRKFYRGRDKIRDTEIFSVACQQLVKCVKKYKAEIGPFDRFAIRSIKNAILEHIRQQNRQKRSAGEYVISTQEWLQIPDSSDKSFEDHDFLKKTLSSLPQEDQDILLSVFVDNLSIVNIAKRNAVSRATIYSRISKILKFIREKFEEN